MFLISYCIVIIYRSDKPMLKNMYIAVTIFCVGHRSSQSAPAPFLATALCRSHLLRRWCIRTENFDALRYAKKRGLALLLLPHQTERLNSERCCKSKTKDFKVFIPKPNNYSESPNLCFPKSFVPGRSSIVTSNASSITTTAGVACVAAAVAGGRRKTWGAPAVHYEHSEI